MVERNGGKKWRKVSYECYEYLSQANVAALDLTAGQSNKAVNLKQASPRSTLSLARARRRRISITAGWAAEGSEACGLLTNNIKSSSKRANIWRTFKACLCSPSSRTFYCLSVKPQVTFASLSSPAVMDIRRLRRRSLEKICLWRHSSYALENFLLML